MIKKAFLIWILLILANSASGQQAYVDSLRIEIGISKNDTITLILLGGIANAYSEVNPDSAYYYAEKMQTIAKRLDLKLEELTALGEMGYAMLNMNNNPRALQILLSAIAIGEDEVSERNILPPRFPSIDEFTDRSVPARLQRFSRVC